MGTLAMWSLISGHYYYYYYYYFNAFARKGNRCIDDQGQNVMFLSTV